MTLASYLDRKGGKSLTDLSREIGVSKSRLSQLRSSLEWPPELALKVETATGGEVSASAICPVVKLARVQAA